MTNICAAMVGSVEENHGGTVGSTLVWLGAHLLTREI